MLKTFSLLFVCLSLVLAVPPGRAQDLTAAMDDLPLVSAAILRALDRTSAFLAKAEVQVTYAPETNPTTAIGLCAWQEGKLRWDIDVPQVNGPLVPTPTVDAVRKLKLVPIVLLARGDRQTSNLLLEGARAFLEAKLGIADRGRSTPPRQLGNEIISGRPCVKERQTMVMGKRTVEILTWKPKTKGGTPAQMQLTYGGARVLIRFRDPKPLKADSNYFQIPSNYARHTSIEDLIQSLFWARTKSALGLPGGK